MIKSNSQEVSCPACHAHFLISGAQEPRYCTYCKARLNPSSETSLGHTLDSAQLANVSLIPEHIPENILFSIDSYHILETIGKGGMGEVFLAYDTNCGRKIALKQVRPDLVNNVHIHNRFLKEARITSQLTHPAIIPIYTIHKDEESLYYTMPYVEGQTLRQILSYARQREKQGLKPDHATSITGLVRLLLNVCQAVAYSHSKGVIHRDLKPNNIMVGKFGEVLILDWGLAKIISQPAENDEIEGEENASQTQSPDMTHVGKVVGTLAYMAPERAFNKMATIQTDIYALGIILYQILTLHFPFIRHSLKEFRENANKEVLIEPSQVAPYRDVPPTLSRIALKCLARDPKERYSSMSQFIHELEGYIEGRSEWVVVAHPNIQNRTEWEFQEHVLFAEHAAITRGPEISNWVSLMISANSFSGNTKIEAHIELEKHGQGVGFLLAVPEKAERTHLNNGYWLWIGSDSQRNTRLLRDGVEVVHAPDIFLQRGLSYQIRIEKIGSDIYFYLNETLQFSYISYLPLPGTHIGFLSKDDHFIIKQFDVSVGSENITVNCLAIPDAFLAHKNYDAALTEYRRIAYAFPGMAEQREAIFRAGITLLEEARQSHNPDDVMRKSEEALEEFGKLRSTPGAPLEYLGKAFVYQMLNDHEEEFKCFEIAHRRYHSHPLLPTIQEQLIYRMHESSRYHRDAAYHFILLALLHLPHYSRSNNTKQLFENLKKHWETLYFIYETPLSEPLQDLTFAIQIAFWLEKPYILSEIIDKLMKIEHVAISVTYDALFALIELGAWELAAQKLVSESHRFQMDASYKFLEIALLSHQESLEKACETFLDAPIQQGTFQEVRTASHLMEEAIQQRKPNVIHRIYERLRSLPITPQDQLHLDCYQIWALLHEKNWNAAEELFHSYSFEQLMRESSILHFLYGCWLAAVEGKEIASIHFSSVLEAPYPRSWNTFSLFFNKSPEQKKQWLSRAFLWEKRQYFRQCALFYHCMGDEDLAEQNYQFASREYLTLETS